MDTVCNLYGYNTTVHTSTGYTPFELVYGFKSEPPSALKDTPSTSYSNDCVRELKGRLQTAHEVARQKLISHKMKRKEHYDKETEPMTLETGQKVLLHDETVRRDQSRKLSRLYIGPHEITAVNGVNVTITRGRNISWASLCSFWQGRTRRANQTFTSKRTGNEQGTR